MAEGALGMETDADGVSTVRSIAAWGLPVIATIVWFLFVFGFGHVDRVLDNWRSSATMIAGSFVAGSTPQGGGAVAFPVFTKVLGISAPVARTFGLTIQATGMVMASASILLAGRKIDWKALRLGVGGGAVGFFFGLFALGDPSTPFWSPRIDAPFVKVAFTIAIFAVAVIVRICATRTAEYDSVPNWGARSVLVMSVFAFVGGVFSSLTGSGTDVFLFVFIVLVAGVTPKVAIPTSIVAMASVSVLGFVILGLWHGQLDIALDATSSQVIAVGGDAFGPELATQFDLFGIWLAAAPIVVWGAPLGAWAASKVSERTVITFVAFMALLEVLTTAIFLDDLRTDRVLLAFGVIGLVLAYLAVHRLESLSRWIMSAGGEPEPAFGANWIPLPPPDGAPESNGTELNGTELNGTGANSARGSGDVESDIDQLTSDTILGIFERRD